VLTTTDSFIPIYHKPSWRIDEASICNIFTKTQLSILTPESGVSVVKYSFLYQTKGKMIERKRIGLESKIKGGSVAFTYKRCLAECDFDQEKAEELLRTKAGTIVRDRKPITKKEIDHFIRFQNMSEAERERELKKGDTQPISPPGPSDSK